MQSIPVLSKASKLGGWFTIEDSVKPVSYHNDLQRMTAKMIVSGHVYTTLVQLGSIDKPLPVELFHEILGHTRKTLPSTLESAVVIFFPMGGKICTGSGVETTVSSTLRTARYFAIIETRWKASSGDTGRVDARNWAKESSRILSPYSYACMRHTVDAINDPLLDDQRKEDIGAHDIGYHDSNLMRLQEIKTLYDPTNFFCMNANVAPKSA
jgi:hypothetical protein